MTASLNIGALRKLAQAPTRRFVLDLSDATLLQCCEAYATYQQKKNSNFRISVTGKIKKMEQLTHEEFEPLQVTDEFWVSFISWLIMDEGLSLNTVYNYCGDLKRALSFAQRHGATLDPTFDEYDVDKFLSEKPALDLHQIHTLYDYDFAAKTKEVYRKRRMFVREKVERVVSRRGKTRTVIKERVIEKWVNTKVTKPVLRADQVKTYERVRDMLLLSCMLFQRHSDMVRITPDCFNEDKSVFTIVQQKTGNKAVVDLKKYCMDYKICKAILEKYNYHSPYITSTNVYNKHIHDMLKFIGGTFASEWKSEYKACGEIHTKISKLYEVITSHTGRRTAITHNALVKKIPHLLVMKCSGHSDFRSFQRYLCGVEE